jgi:uncharacterized lipoprotein YmbA
MKTHTIIFILVATAAAATTSLLGGCGSLKRPYPEKTLHAIHISELSGATTGASPAAAPTTLPSKLVLRVDRVNCAEPFDATTFIYQIGDSTYESDYYNGFVAPPSRLLTGEIAGYLARSSLYSTVFSGDSTADYQLRLETNVTSLCGDYRNESSPKAVVAVRFFLIDQSHGRYVVVFDKSYSQSTPISDKGPDALIKAWEAGWTQILSQLSGDLRAVSVPTSAP